MHACTHAYVNHTNNMENIWLSHVTNIGALYVRRKESVGHAHRTRVCRCRTYSQVRVRACACLHGRARVFLRETTRTHTLECACRFSAHFVTCVLACNFCGVWLYCAYLCLNMFVWVSTPIYMYTRIYTYIYIYMYTHIYIRSYILPNVDLKKFFICTLSLWGIFLIRKIRWGHTNTHTHTHNFVSLVRCFGNWKALVHTYFLSSLPPK